jgi:hypothetical protein
MRSQHQLCAACYFVMRTHTLSPLRKHLLTLPHACRVFLLTGILSTLARFFKHGERALMLPLAPPLWQHIRELPARFAVRSSPLARQLTSKLAQRIALTLLDPTAKSATVLATRAARRRGGGTSAAPARAGAPSAAGGEVLALTRDGLEVIPGVIDALLTALRDADTVVRWSAAKGLGRIAARLPSQCAEDVNDALLELFSPAEMDAAWQGACLALAEVVRHGLLPTQRLPEVRWHCMGKPGQHMFDFLAAHGSLNLYLGNDLIYVKSGSQIASILVCILTSCVRAARSYPRPCILAGCPFGEHSAPLRRTARSAQCRRPCA